MPNETENDWVRPPRQGERLCSLSGPTLHRYAKAGSIRTRRLILPGKKKGCTFFNLSDIRSLIENAPSAPVSATLPEEA